MNTEKQYGKSSVAKSRNHRKVIVFGIFAVDISFYTSRQVQAGETLIANSSKIGPGGKASNQAIASKKLGAETLLISRLGNDSFKDYAVGIWEKTGLKYLISIDNKNPTGKAGILINDNTAENSVVVDPGASLNLGLRDFSSSQHLFNEGDIFLTQFEQSADTTLACLKKAKEKKMLTIFNPAPFNKISKDVFNYCNIITPNQVEAEQLTGLELKGKSDVKKAMFKIADLGVSRIIITLGKKGAAIFERNKLFFSPGKNFGKALDTTGAGDCFNGALASQLAKGRDLREAVDFACSAAALSVLKKGTAESMPNLSMLKKFTIPKPN